MRAPTPIPSRSTASAPDAPRPADVPANLRANLPAPLAHGALVGPLPRLDDEDASAYDALLERVAGAVAPADVLEEMWVRDVVDLAWEGGRLRRLGAALLRAAAHEGVCGVLTPILGLVEARNLANQWSAGRRRAVRRVDALPRAAGLGLGVGKAQT